MKVNKIFLAITFLVASSTFAGQPQPITTYVHRGLAAIGNTFSINAPYIREKMHTLGNQFLAPLSYLSKPDSEKLQSLNSKKILIKTTATIGIILAAGGIGWHYWAKNKTAASVVQPQAPTIQPQSEALPFPLN
jgi:hypothetical protein